MALLRFPSYPMHGAAMTCLFMCMACRHEYNSGGLLDEAVRSMEELKHGCRVRIHGLIGAPQHNGEQGVTISFDAEREIWSVEVGEPEVRPLHFECSQGTACSDRHAISLRLAADRAMPCIREFWRVEADQAHFAWALSESRPPDSPALQPTGYGGSAMCRNAAMRLIDPNLSFSNGNFIMVCCAVNQLARNQNHEAPNVKHQIRLLSMRMAGAADDVPAETS